MGKYTCMVGYETAPTKSLIGMFFETHFLKIKNLCIKGMFYSRNPHYQTTEHQEVSNKSDSRN